MFLLCSCFWAGNPFSSIFSSGSLLSNEFAFPKLKPCLGMIFPQGTFLVISVLSTRFLFNGNKAAFYTFALSATLSLLPLFLSNCVVLISFSSPPVDIRKENNNHDTTWILYCHKISFTLFQIPPLLLNSALLKLSGCGEIANKSVFARYNMNGPYCNSP